MTIFRWDIDKTYLQTDFETVSGLLKTATENASEKITVPGAKTLVQCLQRLPESIIIFLSGSPTQMRRVLSEKFRLDGVQVDRLILKDSLESIRKWHLRDITSQFPYKLSSLIQDRTENPSMLDEYLFGDSSEADAFVYATYSLLLSGHIGVAEVTDILEFSGAYRTTLEKVEQDLKHLKECGVVRRAFIRLIEGGVYPEFTQLYPIVTPVYHWSQAAILLYEDKILSLSDLQRIVASEGRSPAHSANLTQDLQRRGFLSSRTAQELYQFWGCSREILSVHSAPKKMTLESVRNAMEGKC